MRSHAVFAEMLLRLWRQALHQQMQGPAAQMDSPDGIG
jgi:hypothetical protein